MFRKCKSDAADARQVQVVIDGVAVSADDGEPLAAVLLRTPPFTSRKTAISGAVRAPYCMMGVCFECLADVDGRGLVRTCLQPVYQGANVRRHVGAPDPARAAIDD
ncbi:(2Fe-2S)-binding protein [Nostoc sp. 3335mG]|nr:(2Fe-2S)-binding protein [Nostoc sp. 3335mG]